MSSTKTTTTTATTPVGRKKAKKMALFSSWGNLGRLDGIIQNSNEVALYRDNQLSFTAEKGVTFGFLKLLYGADSNNASTILLGVKARQGQVQRIISNDLAVLDKDEYDLIVQDHFQQPIQNTTFNLHTQSNKQLLNIQQFLSQYPPNILTNNQRPLPQFPISSFPLTTQIPLLPQALLNIGQQQVQPAIPIGQSLDHPVNHSTTQLVRPPAKPLGQSEEQSACISVTETPVVTAAPQTQVTESIILPQNIQTSSSLLEMAPRSSDLAEKSHQKCEEQLLTQKSSRKESDLQDKGIEEESSKAAESQAATTVHYPYKCDVCHAPFKSESKFNLHKRKHTEEMPFLCSYCGESFKHFQELSRHRNDIHLGNKTFKCEQCEKSFSTRKELKQHMWRHTGKKMYKCDICKKEYSSAGNLLQHQQKHKGLKPLKCSLCPKSFRHKTVLENHIRRLHTGERCFMCHVCNKAFPTSSQLSSHEKIHSDDKPYKCKECGKAFRQRHTLKRHYVLHTNDRPYKCHVCSKTFRESSNLIYHKKTHAKKSDRLVLCPFCGKKVIKGRCIKRHLNLHHRKESTNGQTLESILKSLKPAQEDAKNGTKDDTNDILPSDTGSNSNKQHICKFCNRTFKTQSRFHNHLLITHPDQAKTLGVSREAKSSEGKQFDCGKCNKRFTKRKSLSCHFKKCHLSQADETEQPTSRFTKPSEGDATSLPCLPDDAMALDHSVTINKSTDQSTTKGKICDGENESSVDAVLPEVIFIKEEREKEKMLSIGQGLSSNVIATKDGNNGVKDSEISKHCSGNISESSDLNKPCITLVSQQDSPQQGIESIVSISKQQQQLQQQEILKVGGEKTIITCTLCPRKFHGIKTLSNHLRLSHGDCSITVLNDLQKLPRKQCPFCVVTFAYPATLKKHVDKMHSHLEEESVVTKSMVEDGVDKSLESYGTTGNEEDGYQDSSPILMSDRNLETVDSCPVNLFREESVISNQHNSLIEMPNVSSVESKLSEKRPIARDVDQKSIINHIPSTQEHSFEILSSSIEANDTTIKSNQREELKGLIVKVESSPERFQQTRIADPQIEQPERSDDLEFKKFGHFPLLTLNIKDNSKITLNTLSTCLFKDRAIPVFNSGVIAKSPPQGYSYAFLPLLVQNSQLLITDSVVRSESETSEKLS